MPKLTKEQRKIVRLIRREGRNIADPKQRAIYERAAVQTGLVESGLRNLSYGDADSQGWRQERASLYKDPMNLRASIRRFRQEFEQQYDPGEHSYEVAAQVQRPAEQFRGRYKDVAGEAAGILGRAGDPLPSVRSQRSQASYETVPGVDNTELRQQLKLTYLQDRGKPNALLDLAAGLDGAQDIPAKRVKLSDGSGTLRTTPRTRARGRGLPTAVRDLDRLIGSYGAPITAKQEPGHAAGGDHDPAVKGATARDIGGDEQTREQLFRALTRRLGIKNAVYKGSDINVVKNGVRYQIISRDHGTGPHLHVGMRRVRRG